MTTTHASPHSTTIPAPPHWYSIQLQLRYKTTFKHGALYGSGQTRMMSSKDIIFAPGDKLEPGMKAEVAVAWPLLLDGHIRLQLILEVTITSNQDGVAEARILAYHFHTRRPAGAEQRAEPARIEGPAPAIRYPMAVAP